MVSESPRRSLTRSLSGKGEELFPTENHHQLCAAARPFSNLPRGVVPSATSEDAFNRDSSSRRGWRGS